MAASPRPNRRVVSAEQARGFHQLRRHQPAAGLLAQMRTRVTPELDTPCAQVPVLVVALAADVAQQPGQQRQMDLFVGQMDLFVGRRLGVQAPAVLGHHGVQLRVDVAPFAHLARADEVVAQPLLLLAVGQLVRGGARLGHTATGLDPLPQLQVAGELGLLVVELAVSFIGRLGLFLRAVAHVLAAERRGDDQHLAQRLAPARFQDHAAHPRIMRPTRGSSGRRASSWPMAVSSLFSSTAFNSSSSA